MLVSHNRAVLWVIVCPKGSLERHSELSEFFVGNGIAVEQLLDGFAHTAAFGEHEANGRARPFADLDGREFIAMLCPVWAVFGEPAADGERTEGYIFFGGQKHVDAPIPGDRAIHCRVCVKC